MMNGVDTKDQMLAFGILYRQRSSSINVEHQEAIFETTECLSFIYLFLPKNMALLSLIAI